jgi:Tol biopolymer transport system component
VRAAASALALCVLAAGCAASREASSASSAAIAGGASSAREASSAAPSDADSLRRPGERHLRRIRQLTFGGENAEGYFSFDGERLAFQSTREPFACDQIFTMRLDGGDVQLMSTGRGRTTCSYFLPGNREVLYASTHEGGDDCPPRPDHSRGYVWALYDYDIFVARAGEAGGASPIVRRLTAHTGYDAEATVSPAGDRIVWTSLRDGDLDLYSMNIDGGDVRRLTRDLGYDGGAFFSPDGRRIVYRAHHPTSPDEIARYTELLAQNLVEPRALEIFVADADGANARAVTSNGAANFAPYWHPDGRRILFASNMGDARGRDFDVYMIRDDGTGLERVVADSTFDGFPVFSPDGKRLVFASNRASRVRGETNLFIADWVE